MVAAAPLITEKNVDQACMSLLQSAVPEPMVAKVALLTVASAAPLLGPGSGLYSRRPAAAIAHD
jgi:hypothetical protein